MDRALARRAISFPSISPCAVMLGVMKRTTALRILSRHWKWCLAGAACVLVIMAAIVWLAPWFPFQPCMLWRNSTITSTPEVWCPEFTDELERILSEHYEGYRRVGSTILIKADLALDNEIRSKYTAQAIGRAARNRPGYKPPDWFPEEWKAKPAAINR